MEPPGDAVSQEGYDRGPYIAALRSPAARWAVLAALTALYVLAGKLGLHLAIVHASATAVWPPTLEHSPGRFRQSGLKPRNNPW